TLRVIHEDFLLAWFISPSKRREANSPAALEAGGDMATATGCIQVTAAPPGGRAAVFPLVLFVVAGYGRGGSPSGLILILVLRLWRADLTVPLGYSSDTLMALGWIKSILDHGWYLHNPSLGAPFGLDMSDFPLADGLHFLVIKLLTLVASGPGTVFN